MYEVNVFDLCCLVFDFVIVIYNFGVVLVKKVNDYVEKFGDDF